MVWCLPPGSAGRAPQASRHSSRADVAFDAGAGGVMGPGVGLVVRLEPLTGVAALFGVEDGLGPVADAETDSVSVVLEHALTTDATPTLPASLSSWRRLTESGCSSGRPGAGTHMVFTIRT